jgi:transcription initiation factor TFIIE subunit alpha
MSSEERLITEVPSSLKQLARLVVRGFYTIEDALIIDMLVRNPCKYKNLILLYNL